MVSSLPRLSLSAPTLTPSPSKSSSVTVYANSISLPRADSKAASRSVPPTFTARVGEPPISTTDVKFTENRIVSPVR